MSYQNQSKRGNNGVYHSLPPINQMQPNQQVQGSIIAKPKNIIQEGFDKNKVNLNFRE